MSKSPLSRALGEEGRYGVSCRNIFISPNRLTWQWVSLTEYTIHVNVKFCYETPTSEESGGLCAIFTAKYYFVLQRRRGGLRENICIHCLRFACGCMQSVPLHTLTGTLKKYLCHYLRCQHSRRFAPGTWVWKDPCVDYLTNQPSRDNSVDDLSFPQSRNDGLACMLTRHKLGVLLEVCQNEVGHDVEAYEQEDTDL